jgi:hypothetical protein
MTYKKNVPLAITVIAAGIGIIWLARRRSQEVPGLSAWQRVLAEKHGETKAQQLSEQVCQLYTSLLAERPLPDNPILRRHTTQNILPGLALYQVLLQEYGDDRQAALTEVDEAFRARSFARNRLLLAPLKVLPAPFRVFKLAFKGMMKAFPAEGWDFEYVEDSDDRIAFNGTRCFYLNTLTAYGVPELTASFCKTDDVMAELFPPDVRFVRLHTLGRGDDVCDFQYCRVPRLGQNVKQP